jgi:hypothetical protein
MDELFDRYLQLFQRSNIALRVKGGASRHEVQMHYTIIFPEAVSITSPAEGAVLNFFGAGKPL